MFRSDVRKDAGGQLSQPISLVSLFPSNALTALLRSPPSRSLDAVEVGDQVPLYLFPPLQLSLISLFPLLCADCSCLLPHIRTQVLGYCGGWRRGSPVGAVPDDVRAAAAARERELVSQQCDAEDLGQGLAVRAAGVGDVMGNWVEVATHVVCICVFYLGFCLTLILPPYRRSTAWSPGGRWMWWMGSAKMWSRAMSECSLGDGLLYRFTAVQPYCCKAAVQLLCDCN